MVEIIVAIEREYQQDKAFLAFLRRILKRQWEEEKTKSVGVSNNAKQQKKNLSARMSDFGYFKSRKCYPITYI